MNHNPTKIRPALIYIGGKSLLSRRILSFISEHRTYVEPFAGGLNVLLNKYRSQREVASDLNTQIIDFYEYLVQDSSQVCDRLREIFSDPRSKDVIWLKGLFLKAKRDVQSENPLQRSIDTIIKYQMSRNGQGDQFFMPLDPDVAKSHIEKWGNLIDSLKVTADRLRGVEFRKQDAFEAIRELDSPGTAFYIDPPYYPSTRVSGRSYQNELTAFEHLKLLRLLKSCQGQVVLSGYPSLVYDEELRGWGRYEFDISCHSAQSSGSWTKDPKQKTRVTEVLWVKPHRFF